MKREELRNKLTDILSAAMSGGINLTQAERSIWDLFNSGLPPAEGAIKVQWSGYGELGNISQKPLQPTAEGAEEIIDSIVESLGDPINIHNHAFEIRPYTVEHKTEWWIFHKEAGPGEPLKQWLSKFATLHSQQMAEKMKEASQFILDIARVFGIETDGVGFDGLTLSIDDFREAAGKIVEEKAVGFADWLSKLQPSQKVSVWSKNGEHRGLFTMDNEQLYKKYLKSIEP